MPRQVEVTDGRGLSDHARGRDMMATNGLAQKLGYGRQTAIRHGSREAARYYFQEARRKGITTKPKTK